MKRLALVVVVVLPSVSSAQSSMSGNDLHNICTTDPASALAYVMGVTDGVRLYSGQLPPGALPLCIPNGVTNNQARDITCKFTRDRPELRHLNGPLIVVLALVGAFPCP